MTGENLHKGHRKRLREKYIENGIAALKEHEVMELMLFYVMAQTDTNKVGHNLLEACSGLANVFEADRERLSDVSGVGENTADFLEFESDVMRVYEERRCLESPRVFVHSAARKFVFGLFADNPKERRMYMILIGRQNSIISAELLASGDYFNADIDMRQVVRYAVELEAVSVVFAHNHTNGRIMPSDDDFIFTENAERAFKFADVELRDHIIITGPTFVSIKNDIRNYKKIISPFDN